MTKQGIHQNAKITMFLALFIVKDQRTTSKGKYS